MNTVISIREKNINVQLNPHAIKIYNNHDLLDLLTKHAEAATAELIAGIRKEYFKLFNEDFKVSDSSIAVEIWAHIYAEKFAESVKSFSSIALADKIADKIIYHAVIINIGETGHDDNRFVWDALSHFKSAIAGLLFIKQNK